MDELTFSAIDNEDVHSTSAAGVGADIFAWQGAGIVLLGHRASDRWIVARGWLGADTMTDVRRWSFDSPEAFGNQMRRLALDATADRAAADAVRHAARRWATTAA